MAAAKRVQEEYIDGQKPLKIEISSIDEYPLLANLAGLDPDEMAALLKTMQGWIREKHKGRAAVIQLPDGYSPNR